MIKKPKRKVRKSAAVRPKTIVSDIVEALMSDRDYFMSWQANIAVYFQDECARKKIGPRKKVHEVSNAAAFNFLKMLILAETYEEGK